MVSQKSHRQSRSGTQSSSDRDYPPQVYRYGAFPNTTADHSNPDNSAEIDPRSIDPDFYVENEASGTLESPHIALPYYVQPSDQTHASLSAPYDPEDYQVTTSQYPTQPELVYRTRPAYGSPNSDYWQHQAHQVTHTNDVYSHSGFHASTSPDTIALSATASNLSVSPRMKNAFDHIGAWDDYPQATDYPASPEPERGREERKRLKFSNLPGRSRKTESTERQRSTSQNAEKRNRRKK